MFTNSYIDLIYRKHLKLYREWVNFFDNSPVGYCSLWDNAPYNPTDHKGV